MLFTLFLYPLKSSVIKIKRPLVPLLRDNYFFFCTQTYSQKYTYTYSYLFYLDKIGPPQSRESEFNGDSGCSLKCPWQTPAQSDHLNFVDLSLDGQVW